MSEKPPTPSVQTGTTDQLVIGEARSSLARLRRHARTAADDLDFDYLSSALDDLEEQMGQPKTSARWEPNGTAESVHAAAAAYARCPGGTGSRYRERLLEAALAWAEEPFVQPTEQEKTSGGAKGEMRGSSPERKPGVDQPVAPDAISPSLADRGPEESAVLPPSEALLAIEHAVLSASTLEIAQEDVRRIASGRLLPSELRTANVSPVDRWDARAGTWLDRSALEMPARSGSAIAARYSLAAELRQAWEAGFNEGGDEMREENRKLRSERRMADVLPKLNELVTALLACEHVVLSAEDPKTMQDDVVAVVEKILGPAGSEYREKHHHTPQGKDTP